MSGMLFIADSCYLDAEPFLWGGVVLKGEQNRLNFLHIEGLNLANQTFAIRLENDAKKIQDS